MLKKCRGKLANTYFKIHLCGEGFPRPKDKTILFEEVAWRYVPQSCVWNRPFKSCVSQQYFWKRLSRTYSHRRVFERSCSKPTVIRMALEGAVAMPIYIYLSWEPFQNKNKTPLKAYSHTNISLLLQTSFQTTAEQAYHGLFSLYKTLVFPTWQAGGQ